MLMSVEKCAVCGFCPEADRSAEALQWCPRCGSALGAEPIVREKRDPAPNLWGDLLVIASLGMLAWLVHAMLWREFSHGAW